MIEKTQVALAALAGAMLAATYIAYAQTKTFPEEDIIIKEKSISPSVSCYILTNGSEKPIGISCLNVIS